MIPSVLKICSDFKSCVVYTAFSWILIQEVMSYCRLRLLKFCVKIQNKYYSVLIIYSRAWKWNFWHLRGHQMSLSWQTLECFPLAESKWFSRVSDQQ